MIEVVLGDLSRQDMSAIVRAIRSDLTPVTAVSRDVGNAAGPDMQDRLSKIGSMPVGGAVITPGGSLPADFVIHVAIMSDEEPQSGLTVQRALRNGLRRAADWGLESLALPPIGIGAGTMQAEESARVLLEVLFSHLDEGLPPLALTVVVGSEYEAELFSRLIDELSADRVRN